MRKHNFSSSTLRCLECGMTIEEVASAECPGRTPGTVLNLMTDTSSLEKGLEEAKVACTTKDDSRLGIIQLDYRLFVRLVQKMLPGLAISQSDGTPLDLSRVSIVGVSDDFYRRSLNIKVHSPELPPLPDGAYIKNLTIYESERQQEHDDMQALIAQLAVACCTLANFERSKDHRPYKVTDFLITIDGELARAEDRKKATLDMAASVARMMKEAPEKRTAAAKREEVAIGVDVQKNAIRAESMEEIMRADMRQRSLAKSRAGQEIGEPVSTFTERERMAYRVAGALNMTSEQAKDMIRNDEAFIAACKTLKEKRTSRGNPVYEYKILRNALRSAGEELRELVREAFKQPVPVAPVMEVTEQINMRYTGPTIKLQEPLTLCPGTTEPEPEPTQQAPEGSWRDRPSML